MTIRIGRLGKAWRGVQRSSPQNFQAYDYFQRGVDTFNLFTKGCTAKAIEWFEKAIEIDASYGKAYAKIAWAHLKELPDYYTRLAAMEADAEA